MESAMISIGAVYLGPELDRSWADRRIGTLMRAAAKLRGWFEVGHFPAINVVFYVPGSFEKVKFDKIRDAKFSRKKRLLMIQVPIPASEVNSKSLDDFLIKSLHDANLIGTQYFQEKGMVFPYQEAEELVSQIEKELISESVA
jgi:hypothetical protein